MTELSRRSYNVEDNVYVRQQIEDQLKNDEFSLNLYSIGKQVTKPKKQLNAAASIVAIEVPAELD